MEETKNPGDVGASAPEQENPYKYLITVPSKESMADALSSVGEKLFSARGELYDVGMMRCSTGTYLNLYFSGQNGILNPFALNKDAVPDVVSIPHGVMLELMRFVAMAAMTKNYSESLFGSVLANAEATP